MAARGSEAKTKVFDKIKETFGNDFIDIQDNKAYVWANDGGERVQIAITLTCPKVWIEAGAAADDDDQSDWDFSTPSAAPAQVEVTANEQQNLADLFERLGL